MRYCNNQQVFLRNYMSSNALKGMSVPNRSEVIEQEVYEHGACFHRIVFSSPCFDEIIA